MKKGIKTSYRSWFQLLQEEIKRRGGVSSLAELIALEEWAMSEARRLEEEARRREAAYLLSHRSAHRYRR